MLSSRETAPAPDPGPVLRRLERADLEAVLAIERSFSAPWTRDMFLQELAPNDICDNRAALVGRDLAGYVLWWYVADEVHIVNLAVAPRHRRRGVGRRLLAAVFDAAAGRGMAIATLEVRFHNDPAIRLYESVGFARVAIRKAYYADNGEDALVMLKSLRPGAAGPGWPRPGCATLPGPT